MTVKSRFPAISATLAAVAAAILLAPAYAATPRAARPAPHAMPNGTWIIEATPPADALSLCDDYLPTGTRVRLSVQGPTRLAVEEARKDELGGTLGLLAPRSAALCRTGLGATTEFGTNLCKEGQLADDDRTASVDFDATLTFSRLDKAGLDDVDNFFYTEQGAKVGAMFITVAPNYKTASWRLWMRKPDEMLAQCTAKLPGKNNFENFPLVWRRVP